MHFASSLCHFFSKIVLSEFLFGVLLVLSRCCFHHLVENSILYKKDIQHFCIGPILFQKIKSYGRWFGGKVHGQILFDARNRKFYLMPVVRNGKIYLVPNDSYK